MSACADREKNRLKNVAIGTVAATAVDEQGNPEPGFYFGTNLIASVFDADLDEVRDETHKVARIMNTLRRQESGG